MSDMTSLAPVNTFVILDERDDSINDGYFANTLGNIPSLVDFPSYYHNNAGGFNFADGHAEIHRWRDPRTTPPQVPTNFIFVVEPNNIDVAWLRDRAAAAKQ
jgi:prepilin-type processing-associated H-X9-DG protein